VLPEASVAVPAPMVVPFGNWVGASLTALCPGQLSPVVGAPSATLLAALPISSVGTSVRFAGQVMVGFSWSWTVTLWVQLAVLPEASVTVQVTMVVPLGNWVGASLTAL